MTPRDSTFHKPPSEPLRERDIRKQPSPAVIPSHPAKNAHKQAKSTTHPANTHTPKHPGRSAQPSSIAAKTPGTVPRLALSKAEAAQSLGVSVDFFEVHVQPELRLIRKGRLVLVPTAELARWVDEAAALTLRGAA